MMTSIAIRIGWVVLGLQCAAAFAQDAGGAARVQRDADNPLRMIIEAGKLKPRRVDIEEAATSAAEARFVAPRAVPLKTAATTPPSKRIATLPEMPVIELLPVPTGTPAPAQLVVYVPPAQPYNPDDYFGVPPPLKDEAAMNARASAAVASSPPKGAATGGVTTVLSSARAQAID